MEPYVLCGDQRGENNNAASLTVATVAMVRGLYARGVRQGAIATFLGVRKANVWAIVHGISWPGVAPDMDCPLPPPPVAPTDRWCPRCEEMKPFSEFVRLSAKAGHNAYCRPCKRDESNEHGRVVRLMAIRKLGGACRCCGETRYEFLAFDHINGGGNKHRKTVTAKRLTGLLARGKTDGFQLLCHNCNMAKAFYGTCPHQREKLAGAIVA